MPDARLGFSIRLRNKSIDNSRLPRRLETETYDGWHLLLSGAQHGKERPRWIGTSIRKCVHGSPLGRPYAGSPSLWAVRRREERNSKMYWVVCGLGPHRAYLPLLQQADSPAYEIVVDQFLSRQITLRHQGHARTSWNHGCYQCTWILSAAGFKWRMHAWWSMTCPSIA